MGCCLACAISDRPGMTYEELAADASRHPDASTVKEDHTPPV